MRYWQWVIALVTLLVCGCKSEDGPARNAPAESERSTIVFVSPGTTSTYWTSMRAGAQKAGAELDTEVVWKAPAVVGDASKQSELVRALASQGVDGIILAPIDAVALADAVKTAKESKIPVVTVASKVAGEAHVSFVSADARASGALAGKRMVETLGGKGKVVVLRSDKTGASTQGYERGFLDEAKKASGIAVTTETYGGETSDDALAAANGIFALDEATSLAVLLALQKAKLQSQVKLIGLGSSEKLVAGLESSHIDALVLEDSHRMGYLAVATMVEHLLGEPVDATYDAGSMLATKSTLGEPRIKTILAR